MAQVANSAFDLPNYEIFIRDNEFKVAGVVNIYSRLEMNINYNAVGTWELELPNKDNPAVNLLKELFQPNVEQGARGGYSGIIVTRNGKIVFSGITRSYEQTGEFDGAEDQENITFFGMDDNGLIASRIVMVPKFGSNPADFSAPNGQNYPVWVAPNDADPNNQDLWRTPANIIYGTVANNISFNAPTYRQIQALWVEPPSGIGPKPTTVRGRYENLLDKAVEIANYLGDTAFQDQHPLYRGLQLVTLQLEEPIEVYSALPGTPENLVNRKVEDPENPEPYPTETKRVLFEIRNLKDRTDTVTFSRGFGTMGKYRLKFTAPSATHVTCGGQNNQSWVTNTGGTPNPILLPEENPRTRWFRSQLGDGKRYQYGFQRYGLWEVFLDRRDLQFGDCIDEPDGCNNPYPRDANNLVGPPTVPNPTTTSDRNFRKMQRELRQAINVEFFENRELIDIEIEVINRPPTQWPIDYNIGDLVNVIIPGEEKRLGRIVSRVKQIQVVLTKEQGEVVTSVIGTESQPGGRDLLETIRNIDYQTTFLGQVK